MKPAPTELYVQAALQRIRRLRILLWADLLAFFPLSFISNILHPPGWLFAPVSVAWIIFFIIFGIAHGTSRCPVCHHFFNVKVGLYGNPFTRKCLHCGLPLKSNVR